MCILKKGRDFVQMRSPLKGNKKGVREVQTPVSPVCHPDTDKSLQGMAIGCLLYSIPVDNLAQPACTQQEHTDSFQRKASVDTAQ